MLINRNLRRLVVGQFISALGDHFYLIAIPWLGLEISGSGLVAGTLLAAASLPRSAFMLLGGAASDRYAAKRLLILSNGLQGVLMAVLGAILMTPLVRLVFLYGLVFMAGLIDAFGLPAFNALLPRIVKEKELESGNIYLQGANMASGVIGPALAGLLISWLAANPGSGGSLNGLGWVFLINAATFFAGIAFFWRIQSGEEISADKDTDEALITSTRTIIKYIRKNTQLRNLIVLMMALGLLLTGTIRVGFALLADTQLAGGARDFGYMTSAFGAGMLMGMISVKLLPRPPQRIAGIVVLVLFALMPAGVIWLGFAPALGASLAIIAIMGAAFGYVNIYLLSWLQRQTPKHLLGRIMAVVLFATLGLAPISQVLMGYLLDRNLQGTMIAVGSVVLALLALTATNQEMWSLEE